MQHVPLLLLRANVAFEIGVLLSIDDCFMMMDFWDCGLSVTFITLGQISAIINRESY